MQCRGSLRIVIFCESVPGVTLHSAYKVTQGGECAFIQMYACVESPASKLFTPQSTRDLCATRKAAPPSLTSKTADEQYIRQALEAFVFSHAACAERFSTSTLPRTYKQPIARSAAPVAPPSLQSLCADSGVTGSTFSWMWDFVRRFADRKRCLPMPLPKAD